MKIDAADAETGSGAHPRRSQRGELRRPRAARRLRLVRPEARQVAPMSSRRCGTAARLREAAIRAPGPGGDADVLARANARLRERLIFFQTIAEFTYDWETWFAADGRPLSGRGCSPAC